MQVDQGFEGDKQVVAHCYDLLGCHRIAKDVRQEDSFDMVKAYASRAAKVADDITNKLLNRGLIKGATK